MILLDENIRQDQAIQLRRQHIPARFLVEDFARTGIQDPDIVPLLHRLNHWIYVQKELQAAMALRRRLRKGMEWDKENKTWRLKEEKEAVEKLDFHRPPVSPKDDTQRDAQKSVAASQNGSSAVIHPCRCNSKNLLYPCSQSRCLSLRGAESQKRQNGRSDRI